MEEMFKNEMLAEAGGAAEGIGPVEHVGDVGAVAVGSAADAESTEIGGAEATGRAKKAWVEPDEIAGAVLSGAEEAEMAAPMTEGNEVQETPSYMRPRVGAGRPTKFRPEYIGMAMEYFSHVHRNEELKTVVIPSRVFFARSIGMPMATVKRWEKDYPEFGEVMADGIEHAKELRIMLAENKLLDGGFSKFVLASAYGMTEKSAVEVGGMEGKPFEVSISVVHK